MKRKRIDLEGLKQRNLKKYAKDEVLIRTDLERDPQKEKKEMLLSESISDKNKTETTYPYFIKGNLLFKHGDKEEDPIFIASKIDIEAVIKDIDTNTVFLQLLFDYRGESSIREIPRKILTRNKILSLLEYGVDVRDQNVNDVLNFLYIKERIAPLTYQHSNIGFAKYEDRLIFKHFKGINIDSSYRGKQRIEPKGSFQKWKELMVHEVIGHTPLELALTLGLAAPIASLVAEETGMEVMIFHIFGDSTQGKTTAARVAVSPFGYPHTREGGLIKTWNGTENAILSHFRGVHGIPLVLDEASMSEGNFSKFVYLLAGGKDKARLDKESNIKQSGEWDGLILSTAEHSLKSKSVQNIGIQMRLFEIGNVTWTKSAENSEKLKTEMFNNYGIAGPVFVNYLMELGMEIILNRWEDWKKIINQQILNPDQFSARLSEKLAVITLAAELAMEALGLPLNVSAILEMLLQMIDDSNGERNLAEKAYEHFIASYTRNHRKFNSSDFDESGFELWGKSEKKTNGLDEIYVLPDAFKIIMKEGGFEDEKVILRQWRDKGWIDCEEKKFTKKRTIHKGISQHVHIVRIQNNENPTDKKGTVARPRKKISTSKKNMSHVFEE